MAILEEEVTTADMTNQLLQETEILVPELQNLTKNLDVSELNATGDSNFSDRNEVDEDLNVSELNVTEDLNITEKNFTEELNVSEHEEFVTKQSKQKFDDDVFINVVYHLTAAPSSTMPSSLIEGTQFEDPIVIFPLETSQVIEPEEVLEKHDVPVQEEDVRKIADALYDERIAMQIKTEMKSNEGETPKGMCLVAI